MLADLKHAIRRLARAHGRAPVAGPGCNRQTSRHRRPWYKDFLLHGRSQPAADFRDGPGTWPHGARPAFPPSSRSGTLPGYHLPRALEEVQQDPKGLGAEVNIAALAADGQAGRIDFRVADPIGLSCRAIAWKGLIPE